MEDRATEAIPLQRNEIIGDMTRSSLRQEIPYDLRDEITDKLKFSSSYS